MDVLAAVVKEQGAFVIENVELNGPRPDEVLVKIVGAGMCHTDLVVVNQNVPLPLPMILGHEGSGIVEEVGKDVDTVRPGDHVVLSFAYCGRCDNCLAGKPGYCRNWLAYNFSRARPDGSFVHHQGGEPIGGSFFCQSSFAGHAIAHKSNVVKIPADLPLEIMGPLGCGIQTGVGAVLNRLKPSPGDSFAVFGVGAVGLSALMAAKVAGCAPIIAIDIHDSRLEIAKAVGATNTINGTEGNAVDRIHEISATGVDFAVETAGRQQVIQNMIDSLEPDGSCVLLGLPPSGSVVTLDHSSLTNGRTIMSTIEGNADPQTFVPYLVSLYQQGQLPIDKIMKVYDFRDINKAAHDSESGATIKPILRM